MTDWKLVKREWGMELCPGEKTPDGHGLSIDFHSKKFEGYLKTLNLSNQPLAKACGLHQKNGIFIFDATAGLGQDAFMLAWLGARVVACERHSELAILLQEGLEKGLANSWIAEKIEDRLEFLQGDSAKILETFLPVPDVIYLDPMYPDLKKKSLPKKELQILREIVGQDEDSRAIMEIALLRAKNRVVVKRPPKAEPLIDEVSYAIETKLVRFDVYRKN